MTEQAQARPAARVKRGDRVGVRVRKHDLVPEHCALWRAVKVDRDGKVTHVVEPFRWECGDRKANAGTKPSYLFVDRIFVGVPDDDRLDALDDRKFRDQDALVAAIRSALA